MKVKTEDIKFSDGQKGKYAYASDIPCITELTRWVEDKKFAEYINDNFRLNRHTRKRNRLYTFKHPILNTDVILKVSTIDKKYRLLRRLNLYISTFFKDYNFRAFQGSILLKSIGIECIKPIAYWTESQHLFNNKNFFMYEKIHAEDSLYSLSEKLSDNGNKNLDTIYMLLANKITTITRTIHNAGFRQGDPHPGNFLISLPNKDIQKLNAEDLKSATLYILDLDKFCKAKPLGKTLKRFFDLRCMRRCTLGPYDQDAMLKFYLQDDYSKMWQRVLYFWIKGGFNIFKWFKPPKRGR